MSFTDNYDANAMAPGQPAQPTTQQNAGPDYAGAWRSWIGNPENRAALMQMGIALMQPIGLGQTALGHVGQAIGQGGEAADRVRAQSERSALQEAKTSELETRAASAETRAASAAANLGLQSENLELKKLLGVFDRSAKMQEQYQKAKLLDPSLTPEAFVQQNRQFAILEGKNLGVGGAATGAQPRNYEIGKTYTFQGKNGPVTARFKGGASTDAKNWEML